MSDKDDELNWWLATDGEGYAASSALSVMVEERSLDPAGSFTHEVEEESPLSESFTIQKKHSALLCLVAGSSVAVGVGWMRKRRHLTEDG